MKKQKGITLIALIITIIVMLILVGVSVSVALNGGLFKTAKEAAEKTKAAVQEESSLKYEYEIAKATGKYTGSYDEYVLQEKYGLKIGDKIDYDEGTEGAYEAKAPEGAGISSGLISGTYTVDGANETKASGNLEWQVYGVNDEGKVELISLQPTENLCLGSRALVDNYEKILKDFCNNLYGQGYGAESGRSLSVNDICKLLGKEPLNITKETYRVEYDFDSNEIKLYDNKSNSYTQSQRSYGTETFYGLDWTVDSSSPGPEYLELYSYSMPTEKLKDYRDNPIIKSLLYESETASGWCEMQYLSAPIGCKVDINASNGLFFTWAVPQINFDSSVGAYTALAYDWMYTDNRGVQCKVRPIVVLKENVTFSEANSEGVRSITVNE